jgi:hypothetical protein
VIAIRRCWRIVPLVSSREPDSEGERLYLLLSSAKKFTKKLIIHEKRRKKRKKLNCDFATEMNVLLITTLFQTATGEQSCFKEYMLSTPLRRNTEEEPAGYTPEQKYRGRTCWLHP